MEGFFGDVEVFGGDFTVHFWDNLMLGGLKRFGWPLAGNSDRDFGQDVHAPDLRGYTEFGAFFFNPDDGSLTADPALLAGSELGRKNQNKLHVAALLHAGFGVEENTIGADIPRLRGLIGAISSAHPCRNASSDPGSSTALGVRLHTGKSAHILYTKKANCASACPN
jgi:hypothetical protein